jgi:hypothetical protein
MIQLSICFVYLSYEHSPNIMIVTRLIPANTEGLVADFVDKL